MPMLSNFTSKTDPDDFLDSLLKELEVKPEQFVEASSDTGTGGGTGEHCYSVAVVPGGRDSTQSPNSIAGTEDSGVFESDGHCRLTSPSSGILENVFCISIS